MRYLVYLMTLLFVGTAIAQNPTIVQGNYITNVFGNSNFVLNPNALTNVANVTNATRSTTTPLVATSEFTLSLASGANATWTLRAFDGGMKGQNCEARFTYRGFATATTKAEIVQNSLVVASLTLIPTTDPRIASINFPCGDLVNATTFRIAQTTANMTGTNEIGGIYVGLATNMANVAQAEFVGSFTLGSASGCNFQTTSTSYVAFTSPNASCPAPVVDGSVAPIVGQEKTPQFTVNAQKPGRYFVIATAYLQKNGTAGGPLSLVVSDGTDQSAPTSVNVGTNATGANVVNQHTFNWTTSGTRTIQMKFATYNASNLLVVANDAPLHQFIRADVYRFPSSSELVVTPERQNVWGGVVYTAEAQTLFTGTSEPSAYSSYNNSTWNKPAKLVGNAAVTTTNSGNDLGFSVPNLPVGRYKVEISGLLNAGNNGSADINVSVGCNFRIAETDSSGTLRTEVARQIHQDFTVTTSGAEETRDWTNSFSGIYNNTSVATRNFRLEAQKITDGTTGNNGYCQAYSSTTANSLNSNITFLLTPLDQPSNSALYVEGPVKSAGTGTASAAGYQGEEVSGTSTSGTGAECAKVTVNPGQWILYGTAYTALSSISGSVAYDIEIEDVSGSFPAQSGSFARALYSVNVDALLSTTRIVRAIAQKTFYLNCRVAGISGGSAVKTNQTSTFKAVRLN